MFCLPTTSYTTLLGDGTQLKLLAEVNERFILDSVMDSGMDEYLDALVWIYMGRCIDLDGLHGFALRWTMEPSTDDLSSKGGVKIYIC